MARTYFDPYNQRYEKAAGPTVQIIASSDVMRTRYTSSLIDMAAQGFELINQSARVNFSVLTFKNQYGY